MNRKIDGLGRIVIPKEIRKALDIHENDEIEFHVLDDGLKLVKANKVNKYEALLALYDAMKAEGCDSQSILVALDAKIKELN